MKKEKVNWQTLCYRFVLENRKLYIFEDKKAPHTIIDYQKHLIQYIYNEMRDACLADKTYVNQWENAPVTKVEIENKVKKINDNGGFEEFGQVVPV